MSHDIIIQAACALKAASTVLINAGAGMGADSGLPTFRGPQGFWRAYPPYKKLGLDFSDLADPRWFESDPRLAWGFYGHRLDLYRKTVPHRGFDILRRLSEGKEAFVFTSNVDGQFQKAGWPEDQVYECHGSIHWLQCSRPCSGDVWEADRYEPEVDPNSFRALGDLPACPRCGGVARPNIIMFGDNGFLDSRTRKQARRYGAWLQGIRDLSGLVIVEIGAGTAIPSVRDEDFFLAQKGATLIRINPREPQGPPGILSLPMGSLEALVLIEECGAR